MTDNPIIRIAFVLIAYLVGGKPSVSTPALMVYLRLAERAGFYD